MRPFIFGAKPVTRKKQKIPISTITTVPLPHIHMRMMEPCGEISCHSSLGFAMACKDEQ